VYKLDAANNKWYLNVTGWNREAGIISLADSVSDIDELFVDYIYEEMYCGYKGSMMEHRGNKKFAYLDCCPNRHHYCIEPDFRFRHFWNEVPTFQLANSIVYIYMKPTIVESCDGVITEYNREVLFHTFQIIPELDCTEQGLQLIGKVFIRPNSSYYGL